MYKSHLKTGLDLVFGIVVISLTSPIFVVTTILLSIANRGVPFFLQDRPGKDMKIFKVIKFKTMTDDRDDKGELRPDSERLTKIGWFIRRTSIDELPQLLNVIKGDMSLVGPRPLLVQYIPLYTDFQKRRHAVKPGITGWAQVNGRNTISWSQKFIFDIWYVDNLSFVLDLKIMIMTVAKVFRSEGINQDTHTTMDFFKGK